MKTYYEFGWLYFWVCALACYRLTILISRDLGPYEIFKKARSIPRFSKLLKCPFCVSIYVGGVISLGLWFTGFIESLAMWVLLSLAFSSITIALDRTFSSDWNP